MKRANVRRGVIRKKILITAYLVDESADYSDKEIQKEIYSELSKEPYRIPWAKRIEKVTIENI